MEILVNEEIMENTTAGKAGFDRYIIVRLTGDEKRYLEKGLKEEYNGADCIYSELIRLQACAGIKKTSAGMDKLVEAMTGDNKWWVEKLTGSTKDMQHILPDHIKPLAEQLKHDIMFDMDNLVQRLDETAGSPKPYAAHYQYLLSGSSNINLAEALVLGKLTG